MQGANGQVVLISRRRVPPGPVAVPGGFVDRVAEVLELAARARAGDANAKARLATWDNDHDSRRIQLHEVFEEGRRP